VADPGNFTAGNKTLLPKRLFYYTGLFVFGLLTTLAVAATLIPLIPSKEWYVQVFDYPRLQTFFIAVLALLWYSLFYFKRSRRGLVLVLLFSTVIIVQGYKAWPFTPLGAKQVQWAEKETSDRTISLFICNVLQPNTDYAAVLQKIRTYEPDIVITTETDSTWQEN
jgi:endonuclease/exonuclease/phosphatase (EEP) superfamily protein YafD